MPDYKEMYQKLFGAMTKEIFILQEAQQQTEEMYLSAEQPNIKALSVKEAGASEQDRKNSEKAMEAIFYRFFIVRPTWAVTWR